MGLDHPILSNITNYSVAATWTGSIDGDMLSSVLEETLEKAYVSSFLTLSR